MSETKRTIEGRECCYCHRNLPITYFPLKPGKSNARYKACRDCRKLGHSCIPKPEPKRRKFSTDEERKAARLEYQRLYRERNRDKKRESNRATYWHKKGEEPPKERQKAGRKPKYTDEERKANHREQTSKWQKENSEHIREYQRKRYKKKREQLIAKNVKYQQEHPEVRSKAYFLRKAKAEQEAAEMGLFYCSLCHRIMPAEAFTANGKQFKLCNECRLKQKMRKADSKMRAIREPKPLNPALDDDNQRKPKGKHGTSDRYEYHRQYWLNHKERLKARRCEALDESKSIVTDKLIVGMYMKGYSMNDISSRCQVTIGHIREVIERDGCKAGSVRLCCDCWLYPCFQGIEVMSSNLALTCKSYRKKEDSA